MPVKNPKCLVIDASVMKAAGGETATFPKSLYYRDFLIELLKTGYSIILTNDIYQEWEKYGLIEKRLTPRSESWYVLMRRKGKIRRHYGNTEDVDLRSAVFAAVESNAVHVVEKDMCLIEAARLADERVVSEDNRSRKHLQRAAQQVDELKPILWVQPDIDEGIVWLREGAPTDASRTLAYVEESE